MSEPCATAPAADNRSVDHVIEVRDLVTAFGDTVIHDGLSLDVRSGEVLGLVGGSGAGKSTLMRAIIMLNPPRSGSIKVLGQEIGGISRRDAVLLNERVGVMFQNGALFSSLTVLENVALPLKEHTDLDDDLIDEFAALKVSLAGLPADAGYKTPGELSGGMLKRAAVARALSLDPQVLFLDEPSAGLDPVSASSLDELIGELNEALGVTIVMITHDLDSLWRVTDRVAFLGEGRVLAVETMSELACSTHPTIREYFDNARAQAAAARARS